MFELANIRLIARGHRIQSNREILFWINIFSQCNVHLSLCNSQTSLMCLWYRVRETFVPFNCVSGSRQYEIAARRGSKNIPWDISGICDAEGRPRESAQFHLERGTVGRPADNVRMYVALPVPRRPAVIEYSIGFAKAGRAAPRRGVGEPIDRTHANIWSASKAPRRIHHRHGAVDFQRSLTPAPAAAVSPPQRRVILLPPPAPSSAWINFRKAVIPDLTEIIDCIFVYDKKRRVRPMAGEMATTFVTCSFLFSDRSRINFKPTDQILLKNECGFKKGGGEQPRCDRTENCFFVIFQIKTASGWERARRYFIRCTCLSTKRAETRISDSSLCSYNTPRVSMFSLTALPVLGNVHAMRQPNPQVRLLLGAHVARKCLWMGGTAVGGAWMRRRRHTYESRGLTRSQNATFRRNRIAPGRRDPERRDRLFPVVAFLTILLSSTPRMRIKPRRNQRAGDCLSDKRSPRALICVIPLRVYFNRLFFLPATREGLGRGRLL